MCKINEIILSGKVNYTYLLIPIQNWLDLWDSDNFKTTYQED